MAQLIKQETGTPNPPITLTIQSDVLGEERKVYLQLPDDYDYSTRRYPMLCTLDGEWLFDVARAHVRFYTQFQAIGAAIPEMVVVGIENLDRDPNYVPTPDPSENPIFTTAGEADKFLTFLRDELFPMLEQKYRILPNRIIAGWSFGGLCALYSAIVMPELFDTYLCISPAIWWDDDLVVKQFENLDLKAPKRMVITLGAEEEGGWVYTSTKRLLSNLDEKPIEGLDVTYLEFEGEDHSWSIPDALNKGLRALFPNYYDIEVDEETTLADIVKHYSTLSMRWGFDVVPPSSVLKSLALKCREAENLEEGIRVLDWYLERNPNKSLIHAYKGIFLKGLGRREPALVALQEALKIELRNPVPDGVYVRGYHERIAEVEELPVEGASRD